MCFPRKIPMVVVVLISSVVTWAAYGKWPPEIGSPNSSRVQVAQDSSADGPGVGEPEMSDPEEGDTNVGAENEEKSDPEEGDAKVGAENEGMPDPEEGDPNVGDATGNEGTRKWGGAHYQNPAVRPDPYEQIDQTDPLYATDPSLFERGDQPESDGSQISSLHQPDPPSRAQRSSKSEEADRLSRGSSQRHSDGGQISSPHQPNPPSRPYSSSQNEEADHNSRGGGIVVKCWVSREDYCLVFRSDTVRTLCTCEGSKGSTR
jgi:hypothetical protein